MHTASPSHRLNPYPGLRPFEEREEPLFFGRERQIDRMVDTLAQRRLLAVVGGSGSGKSSLVNSGLQPALRRGLMAAGGSRWRMARCRPGLRPLTSLARGLAQALAAADSAGKGVGGGDLSADELAAADLSREEVIATQLRLSRLGLVEIWQQARLAPDTSLLVVVDQFEELFRYRPLAEGAAGPRATASQEEAQALVNLLLATAGQSEQPLYVVLTMRSDFLGDCAQFAGLPEAITAGLHLVPRLSREERRRAIAMPALVGGSAVDPVLLTQLVNDVGDDPDQLSILQHALRRTWSHWQQRGGQGPLQLEDYEAIGTMATALDSHAEQALAEAVAAGDGHTEALCGRLFRALTDKASDPRGIRRPTSLQELEAICGGAGTGASSAVADLVNHFRQADRAFLMPPQGEALGPGSVVDISHESLMRVWHRLDRWASEEAASAALFLRLADSAERHDRSEASLWRDPELELALQWQHRERPTPAWCGRYSANGEQALAFLARSRQAREEEARQRRQRRQLAMAGLAGLSGGACLVGGLFWWQWQQVRLNLARSYAASAVASLDQPRTSMLYALAALERLGSEPPEALALASTLARATQRNWERQTRPGGAAPLQTLLALRDGTALSSAGSSLQRWRGLTPQGLPLDSGDCRVTSLLEGREGELVGGCDDGRLLRWRPGRAVGTPLRGLAAAITSLVQLPDGDLIAGDSDGHLRRWRRGQPIGEVIATGAGLRTVLLALPDGSWLSAGSGGEGATNNGLVRRWRAGVAMGPPLRTGHDGVVQLLLWNNELFSVGSEGRVERHSLSAGTSRVWNPDPGNPRAAAVRQLLVVQQGRTLLSSHDDGSLRLWRPQGKRATAEAQAEAAAPATLRRRGLGYASSGELQQLVALSDGQLLALSDHNGLHLLHPPDPDHPDSGAGAPVFTEQGAIAGLVALSDGRWISGGTDGRVRQWQEGRGLNSLPLPAGIRANRDVLASLIQLPNGDLLAGFNPEILDAEQARTAVAGLALWQPGARGGTGGPPRRDWTLAPFRAPALRGSLNQLLADDGAAVLSLGVDDPSTVVRRWSLKAAAGGPEELLRQPADSVRLSNGVRLRDGDLLSAERSSGRLQRWRRQPGGRLQRLETIETGLEGIRSLALLPDGRHLVIGSLDPRPEGSPVRIFDWQQRSWVGQPMGLPRPPDDHDSEPVAASALAPFGRGGLAVGTTRSDVIRLDPPRILRAACRSLQASLGRAERSRLPSGEGVPDTVLRLARQACRR